MLLFGADELRVGDGDLVRCANMRLQTVVVVAAVLAAGGCGKGREACKTEATELGRFLAEANEGPQVFVAAPGLHLVSRPELPHTPPVPAPVVIVTTAGFVYEGQTVDLAGLATRLADASTRLRDRIAAGHVSRRTPPDPHVVIVEIDEAAPWREVVAAMQAGATAGFDRPVVLFARPQPLKPPPPSAVDGELDHLERDGNAATELATIASKAIKGCSALEKEFSRVGNDDGDDKAKTLIAAIPPALIDCGCDVDLPALRTVMWRIVSTPSPTTSIALTLAAGGEEIAFPAATPWREASARFTAKTRTIALGVR